MKSMKNRIIWLIISLFWFISIAIPLFFYAAQLEFPVISHNSISRTVLAFELLLPLICFIIAKLFDKDKIMKYILSICTVLSFISIFVFTLGFAIDEPLFYPLASYTDSPQNYLVLDENLALCEDDETVPLFDIFPSEIPHEAQNIKYQYYCNTMGDAAEINAEWNLSATEYYNEKKRISEICSYSAESGKYDCSTGDFSLSVEFDDQNCLINYEYKQ